MFRLADGLAQTIARMTRITQSIVTSSVGSSTRPVENVRPMR